MRAARGGEASRRRCRGWWPKATSSWRARRWARCPPHELTYRIQALPRVPEVLELLVAEAGLDPRAAYSTFNMGAGLALYCEGQRSAAIAALAGELGYECMRAGRVEEGPRRVILEPLGLTFDGSELELSAR